jgi:hypothetical protein
VEEGTWLVVVLQIVSFFRAPLPTQGDSSGSSSFQRLFPFINKGTKEKKHLILLLLLLLLLLRDRDLCYSRAFQKSCVLVEELGAAVLNPSEKKGRKEFSSSKVVCRSELGAAVLNPWEKKRKKRIQQLKGIQI